MQASSDLHETALACERMARESHFGNRLVEADHLVHLSNCRDHLLHVATIVSLYFTVLVATGHSRPRC